VAKRTLKLRPPATDIDVGKRELTVIAYSGDPVDGHYFDDTESRFIEVDEVIESWALERFSRNPVILWAHDSSQPPIARAIKLVEGPRGRLEMRLVFAKHQKAEEVFAMYRDGFLSAFSVGFTRGVETLEQRKSKPLLRIKHAELLEVSAVPVPADEKALVKERKDHLDYFTNPKIDCSTGECRCARLDHQPPQEKSPMSHSNANLPQRWKEPLSASKDVPQSVQIRKDSADDDRRSTSYQVYRRLEQDNAEQLRADRAKDTQARIDAGEAALLPEQLGAPLPKDAWRQPLAGSLDVTRLEAAIDRQRRSGT